MVINIPSYRASNSQYFIILGILINPLFFGKLLMQEHNLIEQTSWSDNIRVLNHANKMLSIKAQRNIPTKITFPIHFNKNIIVSRLKLDLYCSIMIAVENVVYVLI